MIVTNNTYTVKDTYDIWTVEGVGIYAQADFAHYDPLEQVYRNINGFYITTAEDDSGRYYFYIDTNFQKFFNRDGDLITPCFSVDCDVLGRCPATDDLYVIRVDEEHKKIIVRELNIKGVAPLDV